MIAHAVRFRLRFALRYRDVEELLAKRGIVVSYETIRAWVATFGAQHPDELRRREPRATSTRHLDEMAMRVGGRWPWLWRAVDEHGRTLDVLLQERRDTDAGERFCQRLLTAAEGGAPARLTTDTLGSYAAAKARLPELADAEHPQLRSATRCNDRVGQAHQPTPVRERGLRIRPVADPA